MRVFNGQFPNEVASMILADSPQEDQYQLLPSAWRHFGIELLSRWQGHAEWMPSQITLGIARGARHDASFEFTTLAKWDLSRRHHK